MMKSTTLFILSLTLSTAIFAEQGTRPHRGPGHHGGPQLTDTQKSCLEGKIGTPGSGTRPSREEMEAAFSACGVEKPKGPPSRKVANENSELGQEAGAQEQ